MSERSQNKPSHLASRWEDIEFPQWSRCHFAHSRCISMATKQPAQTVSRFHYKNSFLLTADSPHDIKTSSINTNLILRGHGKRILTIRPLGRGESKKQSQLVERWWHTDQSHNWNGSVVFSRSSAFPRSGYVPKQFILLIKCQSFLTTKRHCLQTFHAYRNWYLNIYVKGGVIYFY